MAAGVWLYWQLRSEACEAVDVLVSPVVFHMLRKQTSAACFSSRLRYPCHSSQRCGRRKFTDALEHARVEHRRSSVMPKLRAYLGKVCVVIA